MHVYILIRSWNAFPYLEKCLESVLTQEFENYTVLFVDDCSDYTKGQKEWIKRTLKKHICLFNQERKFAVRNAYELIHGYATRENSIIINVDGDDWLNGKKVLQKIYREYETQRQLVLTYGNCFYFCPGTPQHLVLASEASPRINSRFDEATIHEQSYRKGVFLPLHLRTWKTDAFKKIPPNYFLRPDKTWLQFCEDQAIFYPLLDMAKGNFKVLAEPLYFYNRQSNYNDSKENLISCLYDEVIIRRKSPFRV